MAQIFKEYDIRGIAEKDFDTNFVYNLGKALATYYSNQNIKTCAIAMDCRTTSPNYASALIKGLNELGLDCIFLGMVATPCLYYAVKYLNLEAGVMITASHNPKEYNGFKIVCGESTIYGEELQKIKKILEEESFISSSSQGKVIEYDILPHYIDDIKSRLPNIEKFKVVVDAGNGAGSLVCPAVLKALGAEVIELFCEPDGNFPNHHPDPTKEENMLSLREAILKHNADLGIGLDGDADRIGIMSKEGKLYMGDELLSIYARELLMREPEALIISDVKCSERLYADKNLNNRVMMYKTGHSLIKKAMKEHNATMAGELSGHMFFKDNWYGFDDATYSAARLLYVLTILKEKQGLSLEDMPNWEELYSTPEISFPMEDEYKAKVVAYIQNHYKNDNKYTLNTLDGARLIRKEAPLLWALVRASNTSPYLILRGEAKVQADAENLIQELKDLALKAKAL